MKVHLLYFGGLRAQKGLPGENLEIPTGSSAFDAARAACSELAPGWLGCLRLAVNEEFSAPETLLNDGDQLALLPPVSGGRG